MVFAVVAEPAIDFAARVDGFIRNRFMAYLENSTIASLILIRR